MTFKECRKYGREKMCKTIHRKKIEGGRYVYGFMHCNKSGEWYFDFRKQNDEAKYLLNINGTVEKLNK